jgi:RND superfamily putative drug exporter
VFVFAILFGLSMDYQVFLVSRMREAWVKGADNGRAVTTAWLPPAGSSPPRPASWCSSSAPSPSAASGVLKLFGLGLAVAVLLDALIVRTVLVPALMHVIGRANWWLPGGSTGSCRGSRSRARGDGASGARADEPAPRPEPLPAES